MLYDPEKMVNKNGLLIVASMTLYIVTCSFVLGGIVEWLVMNILYIFWKCPIYGQVSCILNIDQWQKMRCGAPVYQNDRSHNVTHALTQQPTDADGAQ